MISVAARGQANTPALDPVLQFGSCGMAVEVAGETSRFDDVFSRTGCEFRIEARKEAITECDCDVLGEVVAEPNDALSGRHHIFVIDDAGDLDHLGRQQR
jgi:hypothetical protein